MIINQNGCLVPKYPKNPSPEFWNKSYESGITGWDIGYIATPIKEYFSQLERKDYQIFIPGAGNGHEAGYLYEQGFINVTLLDFAEKALQNFKDKYPEFPDHQIIFKNFFDHKGQYDIIVELTFLSSLHPDLRVLYSKKVHKLLKPGGKLIGLLFNHHFNSEFPPFGGTKEEYLQIFSKYFEVKEMDLAYNSIKPSMGRELFINLIKKL